MKFVSFLILLTMVAAQWGCSKQVAASSVDRSYLVELTGPTADLVRRYKAAADKTPHKSDLQNKLGVALLQLGRETGDLVWYQRARDTFTRALQIDSNDPISLSNLAWAATIFHDFDTAVEYANRAISIDANCTQAYGVLADALIDGGQYDAAAKSIQRMLDLKPDLAAYSRAAQLRFIHGDTKGAVYMYLRAIEAGGPFMETTAWVRTQLGDVYWQMGAVKAAEVAYKDVLKVMPEYRHAIAGYARVCTAQGKYEDAIRLYEKACTGVAPIPYIVALGDLYTKLGRAEDARRTYGRVKEIAAKHKQYGIDGDDISLSLFYTDTGVDTKAAYKMMRDAIRKHSSLQDYLAYAWACSKIERHDEAKKYMRKALSFGTQDALLFYRASRVFADAGDKVESKKLAFAAISLNPKFHVLFSDDAHHLAK